MNIKLSDKFLKKHKVVFSVDEDAKMSKRNRRTLTEIAGEMTKEAAKIHKKENRNV